MMVDTLSGMVLRMHRSDGAGQRFAKAGLVEAVSVKRHQCTDFHCFMREDAVRAVPAEVLIRVSGRIHGTLVVQCRLLSKAHTWLELIFPLFTDLYDNAGKFMTGNDRIGIDVLRGTLMFLALFRKLVGRHADTVAVNLGKNLVILNFRKFKFFQTEIHFSVHSDCFGFHGILPDTDYLNRL